MRWRRGLAALSLVPALLLPAVAQAIQPEVEHGRIVWTNDTPSGVRTPSRRSASSVSNTMRSARAVAGEVSDFAVRHANVSGAAGDGRVSAEDIDRYIEEAAARHNVDPDLVRAVIKVESNFNPRAVSRKGAMGLMQLMPATARRYDVSNPFDARQNVDAGVRHLKGLLENFRGNVPLTLAAYNAGEGAVERSGGIPPYTETRNYVRRITHLLEDDSSLQTAGMPVPIRVYRDDRGRLVITNVE
jgi:soluble lytic murein transglycosylase-like protein